MSLGPITNRFSRVPRAHNHTALPVGRFRHIADPGNPGAWHGTSAAAPATTVACTSNVDVLEGVLGALNSRVRVCANDGVGRRWVVRGIWSLSLLCVTSPNFRSGADSIRFISLAPRFFSQGSRQRQLRMVAPVQKTQNNRPHRERKP